MKPTLQSFVSDMEKTAVGPVTAFILGGLFNPMANAIVRSRKLVQKV